MTTENQEKKVAIVVADGFEQSELEVPRQALLKAGFAAEIVSPGAQSTVQGYHHTEKGDAFPIDVSLSQARPEFYSALLLPGGVHNPDQLRQNEKVLDFVRHFFALGKPVAAICHGPWTLIDAAVVSGRRLTSWASIKTDLVNAGAEWVDEPVVVDRGLVTSRGPHDLAAFCKKMLEEFQQEHGVSAHEAAMLTKLNELIKHIKVAMLTMRMPDGSLHSCPMMTQGKRFDRSLWFFTSASSHKGQEAEKDCPVNVSYADPGASRYVSVSGRAKLVRDRGKLQELWTPLAKAWFPKGLDDPDLGLLQISVEQAEYWDTPSGHPVTLFQLAKLLLTGRAGQAEGTAHERIHLEPPRGDAAAPPKDKDQNRDAAQDAGRGMSVDQGVAREAGRDAGRDAAPTVASDADRSAGSDTGADARAFTGLGAGTNIGVNAGADSSASAGSDTGMRAGTDSDVSAGSSTGVSAGSDTGMRAGADSDVSAGSGSGANMVTGADSGARARADVNTSAGSDLGTETGADHDTDQDVAVHDEPGTPRSHRAAKTRAAQEEAADKSPAGRAPAASKSQERAPARAPRPANKRARK